MLGGEHLVGERVLVYLFFSSYEIILSKLPIGLLNVVSFAQKVGSFSCNRATAQRRKALPRFWRFSLRLCAVAEKRLRKKSSKPTSPAAGSQHQACARHLPMWRLRPARREVTSLRTRPTVPLAPATTSSKASTSTSETTAAARAAHAAAATAATVGTIVATTLRAATACRSITFERA